MKTIKSNLFRKTSMLVAVFIFLLGSLFVCITYLATLHYYQATTQRLNKDVAGHIARFTSPFENNGLNRKTADSIFFDAMVLSPSVEVYFLDTTGKVLYYHAPDSVIKQRQIPLQPLQQYMASKGREYIKAPDPKVPGENKIFSAAEVISNGRKVGYIYVILGGNNYQTVSQLLFGDHIMALALQGIAVVIALSIIISLIYIGRIRKNLVKMTQVLNAYEQGNYAARFSEKNYNEFTPIAESFNKMADLLTYNIDRLQLSEKARKDFIANISHDLRTPLTVVRGYVETLQEESLNGTADTARVVSITGLMYKKLEQLEVMIIQLFELSKMEAIGFRLLREPFNVAELIEEMVMGLQKTAQRSHIRLSSSGLQEMAWIEADIALVERCIQNLLDNAIRNTAENGVVEITLIRKAPKKYVINIQNTHAALAPDLVQWINSDAVHADHLVRARRGLGLSIVKKILQLHGYAFRVVSNGDWVCFTLELDAFENPV